VVKKIVLVIFILLFFNNLYADDNNKYFYVGKMDSYDKEFILYFKPREKAILAKGEDFNYINDYPQDLYIYNQSTKIDKPLISYDWLPFKAKKLLRDYNFPVFPEDFAYYLLNDNNTLIMVSAKRNLNKNFEYNIKKNKLNIYKNLGKLDFIISTYAKACGYQNMKSNYSCEIYKPLISTNLIN
tara:strand:- start:1770 stop:2321 length:552 start_codon:yes stop_codon:yes gene_type:complete